MRRYAEILRSPGVRALVASTLLGRLPIGINALAIVLFLRESNAHAPKVRPASNGMGLPTCPTLPIGGRSRT